MTASLHPTSATTPPGSVAPVVPIVIVGCGGFGREVQDVVEAMNTGCIQFDLLGYVDDAPSQDNLERVARRRARVIGDLAWLEQAPADVQYVIGVGSPAIKAEIAARLGDRPSPVLVHPGATVGGDVELGPGTIVCAGSVLTTNVRVGRHVHVNLLCSVGHDVVIGNHVSINPLVAVSGDVTIGGGVMLGTHSAILQGLSIGDDAVVGGAALVTKNVPAGVVVKGVPAA